MLQVVISPRAPFRRGGAVDEGWGFVWCIGATIGAWQARLEKLWSAA